MEFAVHNTKNEKVGTVELPDAVFATEVKKALLWEQVKAQLASRRRGTHKTKSRAEVRGSGAKPFRQKGTGRARQGSIRSPIHVGGGVAMGPKPRSYETRLPRSARRSALRSALSVRVQDEDLMILDAFDLDAPRTKDVVAFLKGIETNSALFVDGDNEALKLSTRNLPKSKYLSAPSINVHDILNHQKLVLTRAALDTVIHKALSTKPEAPVDAPAEA